MIVLDLCWELCLECWELRWLHNYADYNDLAAPTYAYWNDPDHTTAAAGPTCSACAGNAGPTSPP